MLTWTWTGLLTLAVAAVAALPAASHAQDKPKIKRHPDVISYEEIEAIRGEVANAEDIVRRLRPRFLQVRPSQSLLGASSNATTPGSLPSARQTSNAVSIKVYVNEVRRGSTEVLQSTPAAGITEIRYLRGNDASARFGLDHESGAILITIGPPPKAP